MENIKILAAESLGVRALCCEVKKSDQKIIIDPGISLGYTRHGLKPHPIQIAVDELIRENILRELKYATDIVFSHFHGDHIPFRDANVYQLNLDDLHETSKKLKVWSKSIENESHKFQQRAWDLKFKFDNFSTAEGKTVRGIYFSKTVSHGEKESPLGKVMMTLIKLHDKKFLHASDIQFLSKPTVEKIIELKPDVVIASGPPLYLSHIDQKIAAEAGNSILYLSSKVETLIVDHHLMRSKAGLKYLRELDIKSKNKIITAADFMGVTPCLLEANRQNLYDRFPVDNDWHERYKASLVDTSDYLIKARVKLKNFEGLLQYLLNN